MALKKNQFGGAFDDVIFGGETKTATTAKTTTKEVTAPKEEPVPDGTAEEKNNLSAEQLSQSLDDEKLRAALYLKRTAGRGRPRTTTDATGKRTDGYSRTSLIVNDAKIAKIKEIAFLETLTMKEIFEVALDMVIENYESKHGEVVPHPERYTSTADVHKVFGK